MGVRLLAEKRVNTFSIVGYDPQTEELGIAVQSKFLAVGSVVPWAKANVGAIATQALANLDYGEKGLDLLEEGLSPEEVIERLRSEDENDATRQVGIVNAKGNSASFTGEKCYDWAGGITGPNFACQGNILVGKDTVKAMAQKFQNTEGELADRLVSALEAGQKAGGDKRGRQSAALLVVKEDGSYGGYNDRYIDLRVDDHETPIKELQRLLEIFYLYFGDQEVEKVELNDTLIKEVKGYLNDLNLFSGNIDSKNDDEFQEALEVFYHQENFEEREQVKGYIDKDILEYMRKKVN
ncbi:MAG: DUF1028 domain-containing protein [Halanaerobiales bacterium]|nr:DUF1028 domain-containing protein [Halanaerobiales bacterium]